MKMFWTAFEKVQYQNDATGEAIRQATGRRQTKEVIRRIREIEKALQEVIEAHGIERYPEGEQEKRLVTSIGAIRHQLEMVEAEEPTQAKILNERTEKYLDFIIDKAEIEKEL